MKATRTVSAVLLVLLLANCVMPPSQPGARIEESGYVVIGGIEQWITIRGNPANPVLLIVHGGPGDVQSPLVETYAPYEAQFVVVQWDQRGAGRTFGRHRDQELSLERMAQDGVEVAEYLRAHLQRRQVLVLGHSWGTTLALAMIERRPDLFAAYIGTGQVASWLAAAEAQWNHLQSAARAEADEATLRQLAAIGAPDPYDARQYFSWRGILNARYLAPADTAWLQQLRGLAASFEPQQLQELADGGDFSGTQLLPVMMATDHARDVRQVPVPFYVIQGRADWFTPTEPALEFFASVQAPRKQLFVIQDAGHFALCTHRDQFLQALLAIKQATPAR